MYGRMISMMQKARTESHNPVIKIEFANVASGAGPRAVGTERGRWSNW